MLFAFDCAAEDQPAEQMATGDPPWFQLGIGFALLQLGGTLGTALLFFLKPGFRNQRLDKVLVYFATVHQITGVNAVLEEMVVPAGAAKEPRRFEDLLEPDAVDPHFPGEVAAFPQMIVVIGHQTLNVVFLTPILTVLPIAHAHQNLLGFEARRYMSRHNAQVAPSVGGPVWIVQSERGSVIAQADQFRQPTPGVIGDFFEQLFILILLNYLEQRIDLGVAGFDAGDERFTIVMPRIRRSALM